MCSHTLAARGVLPRKLVQTSERVRDASAVGTSKLKTKAQRGSFAREGGADHEGGTIHKRGPGVGLVWVGLGWGEGGFFVACRLGLRGSFAREWGSGSRGRDDERRAGRWFGLGWEGSFFCLFCGAPA